MASTRGKSKRKRVRYDSDTDETMSYQSNTDAKKSGKEKRDTDQGSSGQSSSNAKKFGKKNSDTNDTDETWSDQSNTNAKKSGKKISRTIKGSSNQSSAGKKKSPKEDRPWDPRDDVEYPEDGEYITPLERTPYLESDEFMTMIAVDCSHKVRPPYALVTTSGNQLASGRICLTVGDIVLWVDKKNEARRARAVVDFYYGCIALLGRGCNRVYIPSHPLHDPNIQLYVPGYSSNIKLKVDETPQYDLSELIRLDLTLVTVQRNPSKSKDYLHHLEAATCRLFQGNTAADVVGEKADGTKRLLSELPFNTDPQFCKECNLHTEDDCHPHDGVYTRVKLALPLERKIPLPGSCKCPASVGLSRKPMVSLWRMSEGTAVPSVVKPEGRRFARTNKRVLPMTPTRNTTVDTVVPSAVKSAEGGFPRTRVLPSSPDRNTRYFEIHPTRIPSGMTYGGLDLSNLAKEAKLKEQIESKRMLKCPLCKPTKFKVDKEEKIYYEQYSKDAFIKVPEDKIGLISSITELEWVHVSGNKRLEPFQCHNILADHPPLFLGEIKPPPTHRKIKAISVGWLVHFELGSQALQVFPLEFRLFEILSTDPEPLRTRMLEIWSYIRGLLHFKLTMTRIRSTESEVLPGISTHLQPLFKNIKGLSAVFSNSALTYWQSVHEQLQIRDYRLLVQGNISPEYAWNALNLWVLEGHRFVDFPFITSAIARKTVKQIAIELFISEQDEDQQEEASLLEELDKILLEGDMPSDATTMVL